MQAYAFSHPGFRYQENQDSFLVFTQEGCSLLAVADGLGGHENGHLASRQAVECLQEIFQPENNFTQQTIYQLLTEVNRRVYSLQEWGERKPATTLSLVWLQDQEFLVGHVGDSRVYWWQEGRLSLLTKDQTVLSQWISQGRWVPKRYYQKFGHILARTLGGHIELDGEFMEQDGFSYVFGPFQSAKEGILLLATDGLNRHLTEEELENLLTENYLGNAQQIAEVLLERALAGGGQDNITVIVKKF